MIDIFGESIAKAVGVIVSKAIKRGRAEDFLEAAHRLSGMQTLIICMELGGDSARDPLLRLSNEVSRMHRMADNKALRESIMETIRISLASRQL